MAYSINFSTWHQAVHAWVVKLRSRESHRLYKYQDRTRCLLYVGSREAWPAGYPQMLPSRSHLFYKEMSGKRTKPSSCMDRHGQNIMDHAFLTTEAVLRNIMSRTYTRACPCIDIIQSGTSGQVFSCPSLGARGSTACMQIRWTVFQCLHLSIWS